MTRRRLCLLPPPCGLLVGQGWGHRRLDTYWRVPCAVQHEQRIYGLFRLRTL
jgi:hypothetical protein